MLTRNQQAIRIRGAMDSADSWVRAAPLLLRSGREFMLEQNIKQKGTCAARSAKEAEGGWVASSGLYHDKRKTLK